MGCSSSPDKKVESPPGFPFRQLQFQVSTSITMGLAGVCTMKPSRRISMEFYFFSIVDLVWYS